MPDAAAPVPKCKSAKISPETASDEKKKKKVACIRIQRSLGSNGFFLLKGFAAPSCRSQGPLAPYHRLEPSSHVPDEN